MTPSESRVLARVVRLMRETMDLRGVGYDELEVRLARSTITRLVKTGNVKLTTLATAADLLECDVVIHFRERPAQNVRPQKE